MINLLDRKIMKPLYVQSYFGVYLKMTSGMKHWNQADVETGHEGWEKCLMADCFFYERWICRIYPRCLFFKCNKQSATV